MINVRLLHYELEKAGLPVAGVSSDGRVDYSRDLVQDEIATASAVVGAHDPNGLLPEEIDRRDYQQARQAALDLLTSGINNWGTMTGAEKNAWMGTNFDAVMRILRALIKLTT